jgi:glyoxylase-like metal-dependent hydrolase (beta-lactamase superfamily II)
LRLSWAQTARPPYVQEGKTVKISGHVYVVPDGRVNLVPNIGCIVGNKAALAVDSGMGDRNGQATLRELQKVSKNADLYLTTAHFHPEHVTGQRGASERRSAPARGHWVRWFGGNRSRWRHRALAHARGDNFMWVKEGRVLFGGDVITDRFFPILPDGDSNGRNWIAVLDRLAALQPRSVVPGHGEVDTIEVIARERKLLQALEVRTRKVKSEGASAEEAAKILIEEFRTRYPEYQNTGLLGNGVKKSYAGAQ